jgi:hypothetical protein
VRTHACGRSVGSSASPKTTHDGANFLWSTWGSGILLADHTRFSWANPTAGSLRHCLTSKRCHAPNTRRCPAPGPKNQGGSTLTQGTIQTINVLCRDHDIQTGHKSHPTTPAEAAVHLPRGAAPYIRSITSQALH